MESIVTVGMTLRAHGETAFSARSASTAPRPSSAAGNASSGTAAPAQKLDWTRAHVIMISRHKTPTLGTGTTKILGQVS